MALGCIGNLAFSWKKIISQNLLDMVEENFNYPLSIIHFSQSNVSNTLLNFDKHTLSTEGSAFGVIALLVIGITFYNDYFHILYYIPKQLMYGKLVSK